MKNRLIALCLALLCGLAVLLPSAPAQARTTERLPIPQNLLSSDKFWPYATSGSVWICVAVGDTVAPIAKMAQAWNNATSTLSLDASPNCIAEGYAPSKRMTVDTYSAADGNCVKLTNTYISQADSFHRWTGNPLNVVAWVNRYYSGCWGTSLLRDKWTGIAIGEALGANTLYGDAYAGRGMSATSALYGPSRNTDGLTIDYLYWNMYEGIYGS